MHGSRWWAERLGRGSRGLKAGLDKDCGQTRTLARLETLLGQKNKLQTKLYESRIRDSPAYS